MEKNRETDIIGIFNLFWRKKKRIIQNCFIGGVLSIIIAFSIPKEYSSKVVLAPEFSSNISSVGGALGSLVSMAGFDLSSGGEEALYPELYPQIISSSPFLCDLLIMEVEGYYKKEYLKTELYSYINEYQREPWWSIVLGAPSKLIQRLGSDSADSLSFTQDMDRRNLTRKQQLIMKSLDKKIYVDVDKGTNVITLTITMQDPKIAADVAQAVSDNLQNYVGGYRTAKVRKDLEQTEEIFKQARENYHYAQRAYAEYSDQHQGVIKMRYQIEQDRLSNEMELAFNVYNQIAQQLEVSKAKLQEKTPVVVVMQPPVVPYKASFPKKMMIGLLFLFITFFGTCIWLIIEDRIAPDNNWTDLSI
ncbi:MAG TPA: Wzz/FepE/Etk N-terminal domain-containing protein [Bacteroidaceae bacterium]|nr:Wzz/FepE/Etk N-terminal domain-containing protein [Bacteroidaceae bacterium]